MDIRPIPRTFEEEEEERASTGGKFTDTLGDLQVIKSLSVCLCTSDGVLRSVSGGQPDSARSERSGVEAGPSCLAISSLLYSTMPALSADVPAV